MALIRELSVLLIHFNQTGHLLLIHLFAPPCTSLLQVARLIEGNHFFWTTLVAGVAG